MKLFSLSSTKNNIVNSIGGWITQPEANLLYTLAKNCTGKGVIVEIGTWKGKSTACLGFGSKDGNNVKIVTIDPHTGSPFERQLYKNPIWTYDEFKKNMKKAKLENIVTAKVATSEKIVKRWKKPVELLWIDGSHVYEEVKKDFKLWYPHVVNGGIIVMDDTINIKGPRRVALDNIYLSNKFIDIGIVDKISYGKKTKAVTFYQKFHNKKVLCINYFSTLIWRIPTPVWIRVCGKKILRLLQ
jgi:predicted O-methyltransferase YrrM